MKLRPYQLQAINSVFEYFQNGNTGNPIIALPTGTGKSVVIAEFVKRALTTYPETRIMMLTHVKELIEQNAEKLLAVWNNAPVGIFSAGIGCKDLAMPVTFGGVQSVAKLIEKSGNLFGRVDLLVIDECHLVSPQAETTYRKVIEALKLTNPYLKVIGLSATPYRMKNGLLTNKECGIFTDFCYDKTKPQDFVEFIEQGYLSTLIPKRTSQQFNLENVRLTAGEYNQKDLEELTSDDKLILNCVKETIALSENRSKWITFVSGVENCEKVSDVFNFFGVPTECVHSKKSKSENEEIINRFKSGELINLVNADKLTTGFDVPDIDLICMMRPTQSASLWVQMLGRGTRPSVGKKDCLVLDFAGNTERLGPINNPYIKNKHGKKAKKEDSLPPIKICPQCNVYNAAGVKFCSSCNFEFTFSNSKLLNYASSKELIENAEPIYEKFDVTQVFYSIHEKQGKLPMLKVKYVCRLQSFDEYICVNWHGYPGAKAKKWLQHRFKTAIPSDINEVLQQIRLLPIPKFVTVNTSSKHPEILMTEF